MANININKKAGQKNTRARGKSTKSTTSNCFSLVVYKEHFVTAEILASYILDTYACSFAISPLHNADYLRDDDGNKTDKLDKEHYHVILKFKRLFKLDDIREQWKPFGKTEKCGDEGLMCRYFIHADNREKAQYDVNEVVTYHYDFDSQFHSCDTDGELFDEINMLVVTQGIYGFQELLMFCFEQPKFRHLFSYLQKHSFFVKDFLKACYRRDYMSNPDLNNDVVLQAM